MVSTPSEQEGVGEASKALFRQRRFAIALSLALGFVLLAGKFLAFHLTGSTAILSDAAESIVHVAATAFAFYSVLFASRPADESHPYGHGKIDFFSAGFEGGLICVVALFILFRAGEALFFPRPLQHLDAGLIIVTIVGTLNGLMGAYLISKGKQTRSLVLVADGQHLLADTYTSIALVVGLGVVYLTGLHWLDPLIAIGLALYIVTMGIKLVHQAFSGLMDAASPQLLERVATALQKIREPSMIDIHHLRCRRAGDLHHIDFHLILPRYWDMERSHTKVHAVERQLLTRLGEQGEVIVHPEPCNADFCKICAMANCPVRSEPQSQQRIWSRNDLTLNRNLRKKSL